MGVPIAWQEAVAVVRVLALSVQHQAPPLELPHLSQILIDTDGNLVAAGSEVLGHDPVPELRQLLNRLLDERTAPSELVKLALDSERSSESTSLGEFLSTLTLIAHHDDTLELAELAARALAYRENRLRDEALASLTRRTRAATTPVESTAGSLRARHFLTKRQRLALGALVVLGISGAIAWRLVGSRNPEPTSVTQHLVELARPVQDEAASGLSAPQRQLGLAPQPEAPRQPDRELPTERGRATRPSQVGERTPLPGEYLYDVAGANVDAPAGATQGGLTAPLPGPDDTVYSAQDSSVTAPELSRPQMPANGNEDVSQERTSELELLVGVDGRVEQARLVPASDRYQDRMMVSAAKTWRFAPATKDGHPVRYRLRIPIAAPSQP